MAPMAGSSIPQSWMASVRRSKPPDGWVTDGREAGTDRLLVHSEAEMIASTSGGGKDGS